MQLYLVTDLRMKPTDCFLSAQTLQLKLCGKKVELLHIHFHAFVTNQTKTMILNHKELQNINFTLTALDIICIQPAVYLASP